MKTVLDFTQNILSAMSSDEVNSIGDTTESMQVAEILKTSFLNIMTRAGIPEQKKPFQLDASQSAIEPTLMFIPENITSMEWLKYFNASAAIPQYEYVTILPLQQFSDYVNGYDPSQSNVETLSLTLQSQNFTFNYRNDIQPRYCTLVGNYYVIFDSFDSANDSTLQSSKTMAFGHRSPVFLLEDDFEPLLDPAQIPLLLNEAKSLAFFELKQMAHSKAEQEAKRQWSSLQKDKSIDNKPSAFDQLPNFGRKAPMWRGPFFRW